MPATIENQTQSRRFEDELLVGLAELQQPVGLSGVGHGELTLPAEPQRTGGEERHSLGDGIGRPVGAGVRTLSNAGLGG